MFSIEVTQLFDDRGQLSTVRSQLIFDPQGAVLVLSSGDKSVVEEFTQALVQNLGGNARDKSLELAGPFHAAADRGHDSRGPFTTDHIFEATIRLAIGERDSDAFVATRLSIPKEAMKGEAGTNRGPLTVLCPLSRAAGGGNVRP
jgi:hypothetical protein